ncbi:nucleolar complex-associated protein 3 [Polychaeton citri CBS 116435]|uniref:Nucleolar complex-associated protein 3 n=1 Tax=Polychaeton citri CBS 116435 TaxID=1314669 RepID=A0A9P4Q6R9_9PEZI|nr:nucleolar complex-associated protein 3 [Polychaeton citri CBS 116435]
MAVEPLPKRRRLSPSQDSTPGFAQFDLERDYQEKLRRKNNKKDERRQKLPIKTETGWSEQFAEPEATGNDSAGSEGDNDGDEGKKEEQRAQPVKPVKQVPQLSPKEQVLQAKEELARIAGNISESPEENVGLLATLAQLAVTKNVTVKKLVLATQLAVFKDIIPGYRIRPLSKADMESKVSKDVRNMRAFEQGLLGGYKDYVGTLTKLVKGSGSADAKAASLASVAVSCVATLLDVAPHFNLRNDLIATLVSKLGTRAVDADFVRSRQAFEQLFREDEEGHASLEAVTQLTKMMKAKSYRIDESVLNMFLHLRLLGELHIRASTNSIDKPADDTAAQSGRMRKKDREFRTKKERKLVKERKEVAKEMKEADAVVSYEERDKNQSETLKLVFVAYFRILKARMDGLMGAVLEGLARYSHLINQDFFGDILEALKDLINESERETTLDRTDDDNEDEEDEEDVTRNISRESLLCIITAFALLYGQTEVTKSASTLHLDLDFFIAHLYRTLLPLSLNTDIELSAKGAPQHLADPNGLATPSTASSLGTDTRVNVSTTSALLIRSLSSALLPPTNTRLVPATRIAAFTKQLMTLSLHLPPKSAQAVLAVVKSVSKVHSSKISSLWFTEERKGDGVFDALGGGGGVEASNPFAATIWEGELLRLHFDPKVAESIKGIEKNIKEGRR